MSDKITRKNAARSGIGDYLPLGKRGDIGHLFADDDVARRYVRSHRIGHDVKKPVSEKGGRLALSELNEHARKTNEDNYEYHGKGCRDYSVDYLFGFVFIHYFLLSLLSFLSCFILLRISLRNSFLSFIIASCIPGSVRKRYAISSILRICANSSA